MCLINNIAKSWMEAEASVLENYKYANEGPHRTAGSYMLTHMKSLIKLADDDPEMFKTWTTMRLAPLAVTAVIATAAPVVYFKIKEHNTAKEEKVTLSESLEEKESN